MVKFIRYSIKNADNFYLFVIIKYKIKIDNMISKNNRNYERIGILEIEEVMPYILDSMNNISKFNNTKDKGRVQIKEFLVKVTSLRLKTFAKTGIVCSCCGDKASFFAVERNDKTTSHYHLNLWGYNKENEPILFTHDHILARSLGGENKLSNTETMCSPCNFEKSLIENEIHSFPERKDELFEKMAQWKENKKPKTINTKKLKF
jgi:hypothetical protein